MQKEIETREDVVQLVDAFYSKVLSDDLLAPHFERINFPEHKPRIIQFWSFVLLNEEGYTTNVFDKHRNLKIDQRHFDRWLELFNKTVDELFVGEKANDAKFRAKTIGWTFSEKMKQLRLTDQK
ncbi:MAG: group III truncated hemoglobin [Flavobacteriales bacterium]|nr:group III truncated hemoglobin [Flavobacteriales bacterium]